MFSNMDKETLNLFRLLLARLERIPSDSFWAHRASGVRGALLRMLDKSERGQPVQRSDLTQTMDLGFFILEKTAKEMTL